MAANRQQMFVETSLDLLQQGYAVKFRAPGASMYPSIRDGETIVVEPISPVDVERGDVVLYRNRKGVIAHRVTRIQQQHGAGRQFITRGDAQSIFDAPVDSNQILGRVVAVERRGRAVKVSGPAATIRRLIRKCASRVKRAVLTTTRARSNTQVKKARLAVLPNSCREGIGGRAEHQLISLCLDVDDGVSLGRDIRALSDSALDWEYLINFAVGHGVLPVVHKCLAAADSAVPQAVLDVMAVRARKYAISNLVMTSELRTLIELLRSKGIEAVPVKGPALAISAYQDIGLRQFGDLDILIHKRDVLRARETLIQRGYQPIHPLTPAQEKVLPGLDCECSLKRDCYVELLWEIVLPSHSFRMNDDQLWFRLGRISIDETEVPTLASEDLVIMLAAHGTKHGWRKLIWVSDLARAVKSAPDLDWTAAFERARRLSGLRMLLLGLRLAESVCGLALPSEVKDRIASDQTVEELKARVLRELSAGPAVGGGVANDFWFYLRARERFRDRVSSILKLLCMPTVNDLSFVKLPASFSFLYWPLHPARLIRKYGTSLVKRLF